MLVSLIMELLFYILSCFNQIFEIHYFSMNFLSVFGKGKSDKKKKKGKKDKNMTQQVIKNVSMQFYSLMGAGPKKQECQDTCCMLENLGNKSYFFAVYDGHGSSGRQASQTANDYISSQIEKSAQKGDLQNLEDDKEIEQFLKKIFKNAEKKLKESGIDYSNSGTCAVCIFIHKNKAYISNLGDSRAVLFRVTHKQKLAIELSYDHKPIRPDQRERIQKNGGKIYRMTHEGTQVGPPRVWADQQGPGIAITRSLGDLQAKKIGLISEPEVQNLPLEETDKFIVIGSDGCWDVMTSAEVCGFINQHEDQESTAVSLVNQCKARWQQNNRNKKNASKIGDLPYLKFGRDDISVVIAYLEFEEADSKLMQER